MLYFMGNCQADFVSREMAARGHRCTYRVLASPLTYPSHPGRVPDSLATLDERHDLAPYFHGRLPVNQFQPIAPGEESELIVLSLFHENTPLFVHNEENYTFFMDPTGLNDIPEMMEWAQANCRMFKPNPATYLERYGDMLARLRMDHPHVPIVVLARLSHFPAFGPDPFSYLEGWENLWQQAQGVLAAWSKALPNVHILEMDRVFGGIWRESEGGIETHCPFLKLRLEETDNQITGLLARRDIEHIGPMPGRLSQKLEDFLQTGKIEYGDQETVQPEWHRPWRVAKLDDATIIRKLVSGANYLCAEAIASFFLDLGRDYTDLLVEAREVMPVCHMTLHMIKAYGRIHRNPALAIWCDAHLKAARNFPDNGPIYQAQYIQRVESMKHHALANRD